MNIDELFLQICFNLSWFEIIKFELISKRHYNLIRTYKWNHFIIKINDININKIYDYNFNNIDFSNTDINDDILYHVKNCQILKLKNCKHITDEGVKLLNNCLELDLNFCTHLTDLSISHLSKCKS